MTLKRTIAAEGVFPPNVALACMTVLARDAKMHDDLAVNVGLPEPVWRTLWGSRPPAARAKLLAGRALSPSERSVVLSGESRAGVLSEFVRANTLDADEQARLVARAPAGVLELLLEQDYLLASLRKEVAMSGTPRALLREVSYDPLDLFDDEEAAALVGYADEVVFEVPARSRSVLLRALMFHRPSIVGQVICPEDPGPVTTAAAGSLTLLPNDAMRIASAPWPSTEADLEERKYTMLALVANPVVPLDVVQLVHDRAKQGNGFTHQQLAQASARRLKWESYLEFVPGAELASQDVAVLLRRGLPSEYSAGREVELLVVCTSGATSDEDRSRAWQDLVHIADPALLVRHAEALAEFSLAVDALPVPTPRPVGAHGHVWEMLSRELSDSVARWEVFLGLIDEYEGSVSELLAVAKAL